MTTFRLFLLLPCLTLGQLHAGTVVTLGSIKLFTGPNDPNLDLAGQFDYAVNFSANDPVRTVNGLQFTPDTQSIPGASFIGPRNVAPWQAKPEFGSSAAADALEEIMQDIRWALSPGEKLQATLAVTPNLPYKLQILISGNNAETRRWDVRVNGQNAVDEITSLGAGPGASYAGNRSVVWVYEFVPTTSPVIVEMGDFFGGNDGGDRNPIWQALTLERMYVPPTPDAIALNATEFVPAQTAYIGKFTVTDRKPGATHTLTFVSGSGSTDNAKFTILGGRLLPSPFDFSTQAPGTGYTLRVRATDAADGTRFLEQAFTVALVAPAAPSAVLLDAASLGSGLLAGQLVAFLSALDPNAFDRHTFALAPGAGDTDNGRFTVAGNELRLVAALPAGTPGVSFRLRATDVAGLTVETVFTLAVMESRVRINEVLAVSTATSLPVDENSNPQDWIELFNELPQPVNLAGWKLTDNPDEPGKWTFPAGATLPPNGFFLVFASGSGATPAGRPPHTNFSLSQSGERLLLSRPDGTVASDFKPPATFPNTTWGVPGGGISPGFLRTPTPAAPNSPLAAAGRNDVVFSVPHGFKTAAFPLALTATVPGSTIRYTLDGSAPTAASPAYATPLTIAPTVGTTKSGTRIVRAFATHPDAAYTPVCTQSYLFVNGLTAPTADGIVGQSNFYASIRNNAVYGPLLDDALLALPAVSLVNPSADLPYGETESSLELFDPAGGEPGFTIPAGVMRTGTTSLGYAKGSMSVRFRGEYGATKLSYPVYGRHPHDALGAVSEFQELRLRSGSHDTHSWLGTAENPPVPYGSPPVTRSGDAQLVRNVWIEDMQLLMGQPGKHGRLVNLFFNGNYYGIYHLQEHADDDYMGSYYHGSSEDYHYTGGATTGSTHGTESWSTVWAQLKASLASYSAAKRWVDVTNLADYMVLSFYAGNDWDWSTQHNWGAAGPRLPDQGGWKFFEQDQDICLQDVNADNTDQSAPDNVFGALMAYPDFQVLFRDRIYKHLFHNGVLTPAKVASFYQVRTNEIQTAIVAETARWQPTSSVGPLPWDRNGEWTVEKNYLLNTYFPQRTAIQLNQFRARGWYPVEAPELSQPGGAVAPGTPIGLTGPTAATVYFTLDGSDPRLPGGAVSPTALVTPQSIVITGPTTVKARARFRSEWSAVNEATFYLPGTQLAATANLTLDEIHYHPAGTGQDDAEFLEFLNPGASAVDLAGVQLGGAVGFTFPAGIVLLPGERIVVAKDQSLFDARYRNPSSPWYHSGIRLAGTYSGSLANSGEEIIVLAANHAPIYTFAYGDGGTWPGRADGHGSSLELSNPAAAPTTLPAKAAYCNTAGNWRSSSEFHGSPGRAGSGPDNRVVINEILSASVAPNTDFIELLNLSGSSQSIGGWYLSDTSDDYHKFRIPTGTSLADGAYLVFDESHFNNPANPACLVPFSLSSAGDDVYLLEADSAGNLLKFVDRVEFSAAPGNMTYGRAAETAGSFDLLRGATPGGANTRALPQYGAWVATAFPPGTASADTALTADPDHDGHPNLIEFACKLPPLVANGSIIALTPAANGSPLLIAFALRNDVPGLIAWIELSDDLVGWDTSETDLERLPVVPQPNGTDLITARLRPVPVAARKFLRISIHL